MLAAERQDAGFTTLLRSAGRLTAGRHVGAVLVTVAVLGMPRLVDRRTVDAFLWAYFAVLFLTSILNLGLERAVAPSVARHPGRAPAPAVAPVMAVRVVALPLTVGAVALLLRAVGVHLGAGAWWATVVWASAMQVSGVALAGLRAAGERTLEPRLTLGVRAAQAALLVGLALGGYGVFALVAAMAATEVAMAVCVVRALDGSWRTSAAAVRALPWATIGSYAAMEVLAFAYLRTDVVIVGHLLGSGPGATYGLVYRVIDGLTGLVTPMLLLLFPFAVLQLARGESVTTTRDRGLKLLPMLAAAVCCAALVGSGVLAVVVPRMGEGLAALRVLLAAVPVFVFNSTEVHLRQAEGRNRAVLIIGAGVLALNIGLCLALVPRLGLGGAAWALVITEAAQSVAIVGREWWERTSLARSGGRVLGACMVLAIGAVALS